MQVLTAHRLADGVVVFLGPNHVWKERFDEAAVLSNEVAAEQAIRAGAADVAAHIVVDAYLIEVKPGTAGARPVRLREKIRADGPTVRADLGKQADDLRRRFDTAA